ncbi:Vacuolar protein sorting-associated protein 24 like [Verticillium longisporum]|uniref:Vacuolar protein sorting-associated protein 24 like n=1 Tax=Verticillium longisporum TaxID=100787 RepID=A0A8I2Z594_VERLO|nr:Vacuolar protein sorting-associated protein 24 like [Verticillium longisporum]
METIRAMFAKPDPQAQLRKCNTLLRSNIRKLDRDILAVKQVEVKTKNLIIAADKRAQRDPTRDILAVKQVEVKTKNLIIAADKRAQRDPTRARQAQKEARDFARELIRARKTSARLVTSKAQLNSVQMQVNEAFAVRKIEGSIRASVGIMKDVNTLIRLPELAGTMQELSVELMKAGVIEEMVGESLPEEMDLEGEEVEADGEVDKVLGEILKDRMPKEKMPTVPVHQEPKQAEEEDEEDNEAMMDQMRDRLEALRS